jgi:DNA repair protein RecO (recombination protein O)
MPTYKTLGIVLKRQNINEADRLLTILTEKQGKIKAIAKGVRRPLAKFGGHLEPYYLTHFVLAEGRNFETVTSVEARNYYSDIHSNLNLMARVSKWGELINFLLHDKEESRDIFWLFAECLENLEKSKDPIIDLYFQIKSLAFLGYHPEVYECVFCRNKLKPDELGWSSEQGGVICKGCRSHCPGMNISQETVKLLRLFLTPNSRLEKRINIDLESAKEVEGLVDEYVKFHSQKDLASNSFLKKIGGSFGA